MALAAVLRTSASARATASSSICRWWRRRRSPCWPARASAPCIRWCSAASPRTSLPPASTMPGRSWSISASCGLEPGRIVAYKPLLDKAIAHVETPAGTLPDPAARPAALRAEGSTRPRLCRGRRRARRRRPPGRLRAGGRHRSALHHLHLGHDRPAQGHRARQWRPHGRAQMDDGERVRRASRAKCSGRPPMSAGWSAIPTSSMGRCCMAPPRSCSRASRSARPMPAPTGG